MALYSAGTNPTYYSIGNLVAPNVQSFAMMAQSKAKAAMDLEAINAAAKPDLKEYEEKLKTKALTGNKQSLLYEYRSISNDLKKGAAKFGGDWISYSASKEFQENMSRFNNFLLNVNSAEQRYNTWQKEYEGMDDNEKSQPYIGPGFAPIPKVVDGKFTGQYYTNEEYFQSLERRSLSKNGLFELDLPEFHTGSNEDLVKNVQQFASSLGITTTDQGLAISPEMLNDEIGGTFYSYLTTSNVKITENKEQREAAAKAFVESMDDKAKTALIRQYYEDTNYRKKEGLKVQEIYDFALDKARAILAPQKKEIVDRNMTFHKGRTGLGADGNERKTGYWGMLFNDDDLLNNTGQVTTESFDGEKFGYTTVQGKGPSEVIDYYKPGTPISSINTEFYFGNKQYSVYDKEFVDKNLVVDKVGSVFTAYAEYNPQTGKWDKMANDADIMRAANGLPANATQAELEAAMRDPNRERPAQTGAFNLMDSEGNVLKTFKRAPFVQVQAKTTGVPKLTAILPDEKTGKPTETVLLDPAAYDLDDIMGNRAYSTDRGQKVNEDLKNSNKPELYQITDNPDRPFWGFNKDHDFTTFQIIVPVVDVSLMMKDPDAASLTYSSRKANAEQQKIDDMMRKGSKANSTLGNAYGIK